MSILKYLASNNNNKSVPSGKELNRMLNSLRLRESKLPFPQGCQTRNRCYLKIGVLNFDTLKNGIWFVKIFAKIHF